MNDKYTRKKGKQASKQWDKGYQNSQPTNLTHDPHPPHLRDDSHRHRAQLIRGRADDFNVLDQKQLFMAENESKIHSARTFRAC